MMSDVFRGFRSFQTSTRGLRRNNSGGGTSYRKGILIQQKFLPPLQAHAVADDAAEPDANAPCSSARNCGHTGSWLFNGFEEFTFRCHSHCFSLFRVHMVPENSEIIPLRVVKGVRSSLKGVRRTLRLLMVHPGLFHAAFEAVLPVPSWIHC